MRIAFTCVCLLLISFSPNLAETSSEWDPLQHGILVELGVGLDSNPLVLNPSLTDSKRVSFVSGDFFGDFVKRHKTSRKRKDGYTQKILDIGFGFSGGGFAQNEFSQTDSWRYGARAHIDRDLFVCETCYARGSPEQLEENKLNRISLGGLVEYQELDVGSESFSTTLEAQIVTRFTFRTHKNCELDNLDVYLRYVDYDAREPLSDPGLDRTGSYQTVGIRRKTYQKYANQRRDIVTYECVRRGPFRTLIPNQSWAFEYGYEYETRTTDGTEFDARFNRLFFGAHRSVCRNCNVLFEGYFEYSQGRYPKESTFEPQVKRRDDYGHLQVSFREPLPQLRKLVHGDRLDARIGVGLEHADSNIPIFDYSRAYVFLNFEAGFGMGGTVPIPEGAGSSTAKESGSSGTSRPVVAEELEPAN